jgi:hypothetical protein
MIIETCFRAALRVLPSLLAAIPVERPGNSGIQAAHVTAARRSPQQGLEDLLQLQLQMKAVMRLSARTVASAVLDHER